MATFNHLSCHSVNKKMILFFTKMNMLLQRYDCVLIRELQFLDGREGRGGSSGRSLNFYLTKKEVFHEPNRVHHTGIYIYIYSKLLFFFSRFFKVTKISQMYDILQSSHLL